MLRKSLKPLLIGSLAFSSQLMAADLSYYEQKLGEILFQDLNLSINRNQSCESCHALERIEVPTRTENGDRFKLRKQPSASFIDTENLLNGDPISNGSLPRAFGSINTPSAGYTAFSPDFHWDGELFIGGQFRNGRAANLVEQAKGPFLNPVEMAMPNEWSVIKRLQEYGEYKRLFRKAYGIEINNLKETDTAAVSNAFESMAKAISSFEKTPKFNRFDSKFDYEAAGITPYNDSEQRGADLFDGDAMCGECHSTEGFNGDGSPAMMTDFSYDNLGVPHNPFIPGNPAADLGLLGNPNLMAARGEETPLEDVQGRQKVMSLRNIEQTAPYMHNGVFKTLEEVVHFYNTRDVLAECKDPSDITNPGLGKTCWPKSPFDATKNVDELGDLKLSEQDEADIVAYLKTFSDNYPKWGNELGLSDNNVPKGTPSPFPSFQNVNNR
ncbi:MAG: cytochrome-c peroxidase [Methylococcaceae bacterium]